MKFFTKNLGAVVLKFRHSLPTVFIPEVSLTGNNLNHLLEKAKKSIEVYPGETTCDIFLGATLDGDYDYSFFGSASCFETDNYSRDIGRETALKHALEFALQREVVTSADVREIWAGYYMR